MLEIYEYFKISLENSNLEVFFNQDMYSLYLIFKFIFVLLV